MSRFWNVPLFLIVLVVIPFLVWGDDLGGALRVDPETGRLAGSELHPGLFGIGLLVADVFLPVPTTSVIAALGILYGPVVGTLYALGGSMLAALAGYSLGWLLGRPLAARFIGSHLETGERAFARYGGWIVAASRWMPVLPEVVSVSAGVSRMPLTAFLLAAFLGALPNCALFATIGHIGAEAPAWTLVISALVPIALWFVAERSGLTRRMGLIEKR